MKILSVHNYYQQPGGEDVVVEREAALLRQAGHEVIDYHRSNNEWYDLPWTEKLTLPLRVMWSRQSRSDLAAVIARHKPDIAHVHNTHFMISPSAYQACREAGVPVVQSLYNPRLMCPAASFYRQGKLCQDCVGKTPPWPSVIHGCYRQSRAQSAVLAASLSVHRWLKTWHTAVDTFMCATEFYRQQYILGGLPAAKLVVKPHFVEPDPGVRPNTDGAYALFVGRLDPEKGISTLLRAWETLDIPLKIRGGGQLEDMVRAAAARNRAIELVGRLSRPELDALMNGARFFVWPSEGYYETFGLVAIEAFAHGLPVIASRIGVLAEIVEDQHTGLHFAPGNADDLRDKVRWAWTNAAAMSALGHHARAAFDARYTAERNYALLMDIYTRTLLAAAH